MVLKQCDEMANLNVYQSLLEVIHEPSPDLNVYQSLLEVIHEPIPNINLYQFLIEIIHDETEMSDFVPLPLVFVST